MVSFDSLLVYLENRISLVPLCQINPRHMRIIVLIMIVVVILFMIFCSVPSTTRGVSHVLFWLILATTHEVGIATSLCWWGSERLWKFPKVTQLVNAKAEGQTHGWLNLKHSSWAPSILQIVLPASCFHSLSLNYASFSWYIFSYRLSFFLFIGV